MSRIRFHDRNTGKWCTARELTSPETLEKFSHMELSSTLFVHEAGDENSLQLIELRYSPGASVDLHAHGEDGLYYILGGEMQVGSRLLKAGSSMFVARDTLYSLKAGADGIHFLLFRPRADLSYVSKEEYETLRKERAAESKTPS